MAPSESSTASSPSAASSPGFCSGCGQQRVPKQNACPRCRKDFRYITEVNAYPFLLSLRRRLAKALNPSPTGVVSLTEDNVPLEVFDALFFKYGRDIDSLPAWANQQQQNGISSPDILRKKGDESPGSATSQHSVTRVIWGKSELDALCKFQSIEPRKGYGACVMFPEAVGCVAVISPLFVTHTRNFTGTQTLVCNFSYAFLNSAAKIFQSPQHCLDLSIWGSPDMGTDAQGYIIDNVCSYPSEAKSAGLEVQEQVLRSASAIMVSRFRNIDAKQEQERKSALDSWAVKARTASWETQPKYNVGFREPQPGPQVIRT